MATPTLLKYFQTFTFDVNGAIDLIGILDIKDFSTVNFLIQHDPLPDQTRNLVVGVGMGVMTGITVAAGIEEFALDPPWENRIRSYKVAGPELGIWITGGEPNTNVNIWAWLFLQ